MAFVVALAARRLGPLSFGAYVAITTYVGMGASVIDFGLAPFVTRSISEGGSAWTPIWIAAAVRTLLGAIFAAVGVVAYVFWNPGDLPLVPVINVALSMFIDLMTDLLLAALRGRGHFNAIARTTVVRSAVSLLATGAFVFIHSGLAWLTMAFLVGSAAGLIYTAWQSRRLLAWTVESGAPGGFVGRSAAITALRDALRTTWAFGLSAILCSAYMRIGPAVLAGCGASEVAMYGAAYKVIEAGLFAASIVCSILVPYLSATRAASREQFEKMVEASMRLMVIPSFLLANLVILAADPVVALIYGPRYAEAGTVLEILGVFFLMTAITGGVQSAVLIALGEMKFVSWLMGGALLVAIPLNVWLAPRYGAIGVAIANCIGESLVLVGTLALLRRRGLGAQTRLTVICVGLTVAGVIAQHLPWPSPVILPIVYGMAFGWKCLQDVRWSVGALSQGRNMTAKPQCG